MALTACDNNGDNPLTESQAVNITAAIGEPVLSKAVNTTWAAGDRIGINAIVGTLDSPLLRPHTNMEYKTANGTSSFTGNTIYFHNNMVITAYYPFTGTEGTDPGVLTADTRSAKQNAADQSTFDFLYDTKTDIKATNPTVNFTLAHQMSKLTFTLINGNTTVDVGKIAEYQLSGLKLTGSFNTYTGECSADSDASAETITMGNLKGTVKSGEAMPSLIVFPQGLTGNAVLRLYLDEVGDESPEHYQLYSCNLKFGDNELKSGNHYNFTIYVTKTGLVLDTIEILDWTTGATTSIIATIDDEQDPFEENP